MTSPTILFRFLIAWGAGFGAMLSVLIFRAGVSSAFAAFGPLLGWSFAFVFPTFFALGLPSLHALRRLLHGISPAWPFPFLAIFLGVLLVLVFTFAFRKDSDPLITSETIMLYSGVIAAGLATGVGFLRDQRQANVASDEGGQRVN